MRFHFEELARLPASNDNVAIATRTLEPDTTIIHGEQSFLIKHTILQGHRFAVRPINIGENLLSWEQPFGVAIADIKPGDYVINEVVLRELTRRALDFPLPDQPNFVDQIAPFVFDEASFHPAPDSTRHTHQLMFDGYSRTGNRGVGTRNCIVLLGTSSLVNGFVRTLEARLQPHTELYPNIDGIVAVAHTEGGHGQANNQELLLRTLAGFMVNPNVSAVLAVDYGSETVNNAALQQWMVEHNYPLSEVIHEFISLKDSFQNSLDSAARIVERWLEPVNRIERTPTPATELKIGLQCGGSDAFSGISGNPLCAWITKEILHYGGAANLAETDELIGAEAYMLKCVRDLDTARKFLVTLERFKEWVGWHGQSAEGNPSGGNMYRGLYNIYLKSLGAAVKRHPEVRLDYVIDYGEPMRESGFYFMDSPGNDLESVAGQVASGCNMIFFTTGNGSITNFPFVPTIKIVTTTERYNLLVDEMDVNAGLYLDGAPMEEVGRDAVQLTAEIASGRLSAGERAGHTQVQIWRDWKLTQPSDITAFQLTKFDGKPLPIHTEVYVPQLRFSAFRTPTGYTSDQVGLILPTSLCSGQIARMSAKRLNDIGLGQSQGISRFVALVHTEGCGASSVSELTDTLLGYLTHTLVKHALFLEHGCEKTHNSYIRHLMFERGLEPQQFGWASVQLDGGIQKVTSKMADWFAKQLDADAAPEYEDVGLETVRLGLASHGVTADELAAQLANLTCMIVAAGGTVVVPENDGLLSNQIYLSTLKLAAGFKPTLGYAQPFTQSGFHIMAMPSMHWGEVLTGLGATGIEVILALIHERPMLGHPLIPMIQTSLSSSPVALYYGSDLDCILDGSSGDWGSEMLDIILETLSRRYKPYLTSVGNTDFQITRGLLGVSL